MSEISCIVVDDEPLAIELMVDNIKRLKYLKCIGTFNSAIKAAEFLKQNKTDLVFLDIQMPEMSGVALAKTLKDNMVIFTTAFEQYALEGFEVSAIDYILKPIMFERFEKAGLKAKEYFEFKKNSHSQTQFIFIRSEHQTIKVFLNSILYIEGLKDYVKIFTSQTEKPILTRVNLKGIHDLLPANEFKRVHKSYIVNVSKITSNSSDFLSISNLKIPIGEAFKKDLKSFLKERN
jgi:DNA-binding LytR/AlgR family response regulator